MDKENSIGHEKLKVFVSFRVQKSELVRKYVVNTYVFIWKQSENDQFLSKSPMNTSNSLQFPITKFIFSKKNIKNLKFIKRVGPNKRVYGGKKMEKK